MTNEEQLKQDAKRNLQLQKIQWNQTISNQETKVPETPEMNDRDFLTDMLTTEKYFTSAYSTVLNEVSNQTIYQDLATIFKETQDCQRNLYETMFRNGWYKLEIADQQKMEQSYQTYSGYKSQFPYVQ